MNTTDEASVARMMQQHADYFFNPSSEEELND